ncbi:MAG TPA: CDP-alcohol phosphatidyltransferase family protein [Gammaproteobacteria bacterium]|nr:CDP-alcohol phosphatidyltransferase family protein [Gammaproteobacteria bacterium]
MSTPLNLSKSRQITGWLVHAFTASGAFLGLLSLLAIYHHHYLLSFWLMFATILIDAVDGLFARLIKIKEVVPEINGELLDNIVDFLNYTIVPAFFLLVTELLPPQWRSVSAIAITFSSCYQFTQIDAKTKDHFFTGFPSYWNIAVFYLVFCKMNPWTNLSILLSLSVLSFVPIKYVYPSRLDYLSHKGSLRFSMLLATILWGLTIAGLLWIYPHTSPALIMMSMSYLVLYLIISLYRTWVPLMGGQELT